ncbi:MAG: hypothetical protein ABIM20_05785 [candidate division WOR-3 bacterium]
MLLSEEISGIITDVFLYKNDIVFVLKNVKGLPFRTRIRKVFVEISVLAKKLDIPVELLKNRI